MDERDQTIAVLSAHGSALTDVLQLIHRLDPTAVEHLRDDLRNTLEHAQKVRASELSQMVLQLRLDMLDEALGPPATAPK
jgi:hypothetical protein